jgi:NAD dependent epimerase/dehydratase family enzyme
MKIVIPGGSGQVGNILARHFHAQGHTVTVFSRNPQPAPWRVVRWDGLTPGNWTRDLEQSDVCINLAGARNSAATLFQRGGAEPRRNTG